MESNRWYTFELKDGIEITFEKLLNKGHGVLIVKSDRTRYFELYEGEYTFQIPQFKLTWDDKLIKISSKKGFISIEVMFFDENEAVSTKQEVALLKQKIEILQELLDRPGNAGMKFGWYQCEQLLK